MPAHDRRDRRRVFSLTSLMRARMGELLESALSCLSCHRDLDSGPQQAGRTRRFAHVRTDLAVLR